MITPLGIQFSMRVINHVSERFAGLCPTHNFLATRGLAMRLDDPFGRAQGLSYLRRYHEQACAIAAVSYARLSGQPTILNVTIELGGCHRRSI